MVATLGHRGPDGHGVWAGPAVALGHTRLAILDPGPHSGQPFWSMDSQRACTYNGELYNYPELRPLAEALRTSCDTELLVEWPGSDLGDLTARARGMFAFAVHDRATGNTVLQRDDLAIKPLYLAEVPGGVVFASELRAVVASGLVDGRVAPSAVADALRYGAMVHPRTALVGVRRGDAGTALLVRNGAIDEASAGGARAGHAASPDLASALRDSVSAHLLADVEVGLFLSGGTDSSVLARCIGDLSTPARAITLRAPGVADETEAAQRTAMHYGLECEVVEMAQDDCLQLCLDYFDAMDAPAADGLNTFLIARAAARAGLKVCLSGAGGDEMLGGYAISSRLRAVSRLGVVPASVRGAGSRLLRGASTGRPMRRLAAAVERAGAPDLFDLAHRIFLDDEVQALATPAVDLSAAPLDPDDRRGYLRDVLLADADVFGMASGVEIRVPFVDRRFLAAVTTAARSGPVGKSRLLAAFQDDFLDAVVRRPKLGFTLPIDRWLRGPLDSLARRLLEEPPSCLRDYLNQGAVAAHVHSWRSSLGPHASETWALAALYQWGDRHDARLAQLG